ncbi:ATP-binding cassette domain-containing protein [Corynebacterium sp. HMSC078H07]|uniref:ATP-binding cassette domain-containing protein n=1 Tax=Corynebacterium sp. HMSC078H07 TaxID=1739379 RepID=UPI0008A25D15|nr:ATP-binding cassette domain-containing protein [Corynebacterium sp. HMSC078H07]OFR66013.1 ABC transporter [Corynebacterium sp. HMSC078H07]
MSLTLRERRPQVPWAVIAVGVIAAVYILAPIVALGLRVPWGHLASTFSAPATQDLLRITLSSAGLATIAATVLGTCLALWLQKLQRLSAVVRLVVYLPFALPPVVGGLALTALLGRRGVLGPVLDAAGISVAFSFVGVVVAHIFVTLPFVVVAVDSALRQLDSEVIASARGVGMRPGEILRHITLPAIAPAVLTGAALACARSLGEFGTTITFAGSMPGVTRTLSSGIYLAREVSADNAYALSALLIALAVILLVVAGLPFLLRQRPAPSARTLGAMDVEQLRRLTSPVGEAQDVHFRVGHTVATFRGGLITAVIGPNGAGKTTLLRFLAGRLLGAEVSAEQVVMLTQNPGLPPTASVRQALTMVTRDEARAETLLRHAGLDSLGHVRDLSGGQAAQVALLRALAARPEVLVLDEPFAAMDVESAARWRHLLSIAAPDRTTILVTHSHYDVSMLASDVLVMEGGDIAARGPVTELLAQPPNRFVAELAGLNLLEGSVHDGRFNCEGVTFPAQGLADGPAWAAFPRTALSAAADGELSLQVVAALGSGEVLATLGHQRVRLADLAEDFAPGTLLRCTLDPHAVRVYTRI